MARSTWDDPLVPDGLENGPWLCEVEPFDWHYSDPLDSDHQGDDEPPAGE